MKLNLREKADPEVNLTSLIDVVFLLLIFFMVSTSFVKQSQIAIRLPQADSSVIVEELPDFIDVMITEQGTFLVNGRELVIAVDYQRRRQRAPSIRDHGYGCGWQARLRKNKHCDG